MLKHSASVVSLLVLSFLFGATVHAQPAPAPTHCDITELLGPFQNAGLLPAQAKPHWVIKDKVARTFLMKEGKTDTSKLDEIEGIAWAFYPEEEDAKQFAILFSSPDDPIDTSVITDSSEPVLVVFMLHPETDVDPNNKAALFGHMYKREDGEIVPVAKMVFRPGANKKKVPFSLEVSSFADSTDTASKEQQIQAMANLLLMCRSRNLVTGQRIALDGKIVKGEWNWHEKDLLRSFFELQKRLTREDAKAIASAASKAKA